MGNSGQLWYDSICLFVSKNFIVKKCSYCDQYIFFLTISKGLLISMHFIITDLWVPFFLILMSLYLTRGIPIQYNSLLS